MVKEYYSPINTKELECSKINSKIASGYSEMYNNYSLLREQYLSFKINQSPNLTNEYKLFLENILTSKIKIGKEIKGLNTKHHECMDSLHQLQIEASLVTGSYHSIKNLYMEKIQNEEKTWAEFKSKITKENEDIQDTDINKLINIFSMLVTYPEK